MGCFDPVISNISITGDCINTGSGAIYFEILDFSSPYTINLLTPSATTITLPFGVSAYTLTNLTAGTYSFTVSNSCLPPQTSEKSTVYVTSGTCTSITSLVNTTCNLSNGELTAEIPYTYGTSVFYLYDFTTDTLLDTQFPIPTSYTFTNLSAGTYYVIGDNGGGCTGRSETCIIKSSTTLDYNVYIVDNAGCNGTNSGAAYVTDLNGVPPYTYSWSNGQTTSFITGLTSGSYNVTVTDSNGCSKSEKVTINVVPQVGLGSFITTSPSCFAADGQVTVIITGGTGPYFYSGSNGTTTITFSQSYTFTNIPAGIFNVLVTDAGLCTFTSSTTLIAPNGFSITSVNVTNSTCSFNNGEVDISLYSGTPPYTYQLIDSLSNVESYNTSSPTWSFTGLESGTYTLNISGGSCVYTTPIVINNTPLINVSYNYTGTTCNECNGAIELIVSGGSGTYTYGLTGQISNNNYNYTSYTFNNLCSGSYVGDVTDGVCTVSQAILIPQSPTVNFSLYPTDPTPYSNDGTINALITDGTPPFTLTWSPNVGIQTGLNLVGLSAGTYSLTVQDDIGCVQTQTVILSGLKTVDSFLIYNICDSDFENNGLLITKGIKQMLTEGYYDLTSGETNCILNKSVFTAIVTVGDETKYEVFYEGDSLNDYPSENDWLNSVQGLLLTYDGITGVTFSINENSIKITTPCGKLSNTNVKVDLLITYDISCEGIEVTPTPTPTQTVTPTPTPTPTPTSSPLGTCETCLIGVDYQDLTQPGLLVFGNITGDCTVGDYKISWYGPDNPTNLAFTSGSGSEFTPYNFSHPLTGISSVIALEGDYVPIIDNIRLDGLEYNNLDCFGDVPVYTLSLTCGNGDGTDLPQYSHKLEFSGGGVGVSANTMSATFKFTGTTNVNYFAWSFNPFVVPDNVKLIFSGSAYDELIVLEDWYCGDLSLSFQPVKLDDYPYSADTSDGTILNSYPIKKVTSLTGVTLNNDDFIVIQVTPNESNPQTNFDFYCECLETFECDTCISEKGPFKIDLSSITTIPLSCNRININFNVSGCTDSETENGDIYKYLLNSYNNLNSQSGYVSSPTGIIPISITLNSGVTSCFSSQGTTISCRTPNTNTITYEKYLNGGIGEINITSDSFSDIEHYYNSYLSQATTYSGTPYDNTLITYYRYYILSTPNVTGLLNCGENNPKQFYIHPSTVVTTGGTGPYTINFTMPTITNGTSFTTCEIGCTTVSDIYVNSINSSSTATTNNINMTTNTGAAFLSPFGIRFMVSSSTISDSGAFGNQTTILRASLDTIPYSGVSKVILTDFSSSTCPNISDNFYNASSTPDFTANPAFMGFIYYQKGFFYNMELTNPSNLSDFTISASTITNGKPNTVPGGNPNDFLDIIFDTLVLTYSGGSITYSNPTYTY